VISIKPYFCGTCYSKGNLHQQNKENKLSIEIMFQGQLLIHVVAIHRARLGLKNGKEK
jgi:hypothetical protein